MRSLLKQSWGIVVVLTAAACGSNDDAGVSESQAAAADSGVSAPTAGKTASSPRAGTGAATGTAGNIGSTATAPRAGNAATAPSSAGATGAAGVVASDDDAGVPAGTGGSGGSGSATQAGSGAAAGSSGSSSAAGSGGSTAAAGSGGSSASAATFTQVFALMSTSCAGVACHVNAREPSDMLAMPDQATAYKNLVNVSSVECAGEKRVVPGDPAKSELVASLQHMRLGSCGRTPFMPEGKPKLSDSDIALVTSWIEAGAQNN